MKDVSIYVIKFRLLDRGNNSFRLRKRSLSFIVFLNCVILNIWEISLFRV